MSNRADDNSRALGIVVCVGTLAAGVLFLYGLSVESYWAIALPVAALFLFVLGLVFWIGWTIATVQIEPSGETLAQSAPSAATTPDPSAKDSGQKQNHADAEQDDAARS